MKATIPKAMGDDDLLMDEDSDDEIPSGLDADDSDDGSDEDALALVEGSDNEDLVSLDGLVEFDGGSESEEEEWGGIASVDSVGMKRKRENEEKRGRRKKLRSLPTFASYEEYAKMIEDGPEDDI